MMNILLDRTSANRDNRLIDPEVRIEPVCGRQEEAEWLR
jgi:hypothetical protein